MAIIDLDSHLRDGWLLDEIYQLSEPFARHSPRRIGEGKYFYSKFEHDLSPMDDPVANANFKKPVTHQVFITLKQTSAAMRSCAGNRAATIWNTA
jgi:hypothetical protein